MPTLTSTGNVNLTSATNWSPAQVPANGDILIVAGHTLTLNADITLEELRLSNAASRLAHSGGTRTITITTDLQIGAVLSATAITLTAGQELIIQFEPGAVGYRGVSGAATQPTFTVNGGTLRLRAHDTDSNLFAPNSAAVSRILATTNAGAVVETRGRVPATGNLAHSLFAINGGTWTHTHTGVSEFNPTNNGARLIVTTGSLSTTIDWTGDVSTSCPVATAGLVDFSNTQSTVTWNGNLYAGVALSTGSLLRFGGSGSTFTLNGKASHVSGTNSLTIWVLGGVFNWANQAVTLGPTETITMLASGGTINLSGLEIDNSNKVVGLLYGAAVGSAVDTVITNQPGASSCINFLTPTFITTPDPAPVLPPESKVQAGEVYGYTASPLTGNGPIVDSVILATAIALATADKPTLAEIEASTVLASKTDVMNAALL